MVSYALFDLDDTLYGSESGLAHDTMTRIVDFAARWINCPAATVLTRRGERLGRYGTTLEWLRAEYGFDDVEGYYEAVHPEGEEAQLRPDPAVQAFLRSLPVPSSVFTNAPKEHADRVLRKLELENIFEHIFDIRWNGLRGKPAEDAFRRVLAAIGKKPEETLFVDDSPSYVEGYVRLGGLGVLLDDRGIHGDSELPRIRTLMELSRYFQ